jgi:hypothetical protein
MGRRLASMATAKVPEKVKHMKITKLKKFRAAITIIVAAGLACAGCKTAVTVSGELQKPGQVIQGTVATGTNGVTVSGDYTTGTTNVSGSVTVGK